MDFIERLKEHIEDKQYTPQTISIGLYNKNGDSIGLIQSPSSIDERYMERGKIYPFNFQLLVHHINNYIAYQTIQKLFLDLDNLNDIYSRDNSFKLLEIKCTTTPNFVEETNHGVLYTSMFEAELYIE